MFQSTDDLELILVQSKRSNLTTDITGILLFYQGSYAQVIEGEFENLRDIYFKKILRDKKHKYVVELLTQKIETRLFSSWSMECCLLDRTAKFKGIANEAWKGLMTISEYSTSSEVERFLAPFRGDDVLSVTNRN